MMNLSGISILLFTKFLFLVDGRNGVLVRVHVAKEDKLAQDHAAYKDNAMKILKNPHTVIVVLVVCPKK